MPQAFDCHAPVQRPVHVQLPSVTASASKPLRPLVFGPKERPTRRSLACKPGSCAAARPQQGNTSSSNSAQQTARFPGNGYIHAAVSTHKDACTVKLTVHGLDTTHPCFLHWGLFRSSATSEWFYPDEVVPKGSKVHEDQKAVHTPLKRSDTDKEQLTAQLRFPRKLFPAFLACAVYVAVPDAPRFWHLPGKQSFAVPLGAGVGCAEPLGASLVSQHEQDAKDGATVNFAVVSRHASRMTLRILRLQEGKTQKMMDIALHPGTHCTGDVWHIELHSLKSLETVAYCWLAGGDAGWQGATRFASGTPLLDPYAACVVSVQLPAGEQGGRTVFAASLVPLAKKVSEADQAAQQSDDPPTDLQDVLRKGSQQCRPQKRPRCSAEQLSLLEVDPYTFASGSGVAAGHEGKWLGVLDRLQHLRDVGTNAVVLPSPLLRGPGLGVQGRAALAFFASDPGFAVSKEADAGAQEFAQLVNGLHDAGIEVFVQAEFSFTVEGSDTDPNLVSMRGLDAALYYRTGSSLLNMSQPIVQRLVLDSMRHWATSFDIDGFCLLSAESMVQDSVGRVLDCPTIAHALATDPVLCGCKVVAWPRDVSLLPRGGSRGFPHHAALLQHNDGFGALLAWLRGGDSMPSLGAIASQLTGCVEKFGGDWSEESGLTGNLAAARRPSFVVNTVSTPLVDGTTLGSWLDSIFGAGEGDGHMRGTVMRSALALLILAQGTPCIAAADVEGPQMRHFVADALRVRAETAALLQPPSYAAACAIAWSDQAGNPPAWDAIDARDTVLVECVRAEGAAASAACIAVNAGWHPVRCVLPLPPSGSAWQPLLDSALGSSEDMMPVPAGFSYALAGKAVAVFTARKQQRRSAGQQAVSQQDFAEHPDMPAGQHAVYD